MASPKGNLDLTLPANLPPTDSQYGPMLNDRMRRIALEIETLQGARGPVSLMDSLSLGGNRITDLADPQTGSDALSRSAGDKRYLVAGSTAAAKAAAPAGSAKTSTPAAAAPAKRQLELTVPGVLGIGSSLAPLVSLDETRAASELVALVKGAPVGGQVQANVNVAGVKWAQIAIANGAVTATVSAGGLAAIAQDALVTLDLIGVGLQYPGSDLTVLIRFA
jgi:hypothetical protein